MFGVVSARERHLPFSQSDGKKNESSCRSLEKILKLTDTSVCSLVTRKQRLPFKRKVKHTVALTTTALFDGMPLSEEARKSCRENVFELLGITPSNTRLRNWIHLSKWTRDQHIDSSLWSITSGITNAAIRWHYRHGEEQWKWRGNSASRDCSGLPNGAGISFLIFRNAVRGKTEQFTNQSGNFILVSAFFFVQHILAQLRHPAVHFHSERWNKDRLSIRLLLAQMQLEHGTDSKNCVSVMYS